MSPHKHSVNKHEPSNYCRNPDGEDGIWCYTADPNKRWEYCNPLKYLFKCADMSLASSIQECSVIDGSNYSSTYPCQCGSAQCRSDRKCTASTSSCAMVCDETYSGDGADYGGCQNKTRKGFTCQRWGEQSPHSHRYSGMAKHGNYCRNPDGEPSIWCYTTDPKKRWDNCDPLPASSPQLPMMSQPGNPDTCWPMEANKSPSSPSATSTAPSPPTAVATTTAATTAMTTTEMTTSTAMTTSKITTTPMTTATTSAGTCDETLSGEKGAGYRGCQSITRSGETCQRR